MMPENIRKPKWIEELITEMDDRYHYNDSWGIRDGAKALWFILVLIFLAVGLTFLAANVRREDDLLRDKCSVVDPPKTCRYIGN